MRTSKKTDRTTNDGPTAASVRDLRRLNVCGRFVCTVRSARRTAGNAKHELAAKLYDCPWQKKLGRRLRSSPAAGGSAQFAVFGAAASAPTTRDPTRPRALGTAVTAARGRGRAHTCAHVDVDLLVLAFIEATPLLPVLPAVGHRPIHDDLG